MDTNERKAVSPRTWLGAAGLLGAGLLAGGVLAGSLSAGAATNSTSGSASTSANANASGANGAAPAGNPARVAHGPGETLLTGATASKVTAAAKAAVPGATVIRVETDSSGAAYEAHMQKADGSYVTVTFDSNFKVISTGSGFGGGPQQGSGSGA